MLSSKHNIKPAKSIYDDIDKIGEMKKESENTHYQIEQITFYFKI